MEKQRLTTREITVFAMLGGLMYVSKMLMEWIPNVHLLGVFIIVFTIVYKKKALVIIYTYVFIIGATNGFSPWWYPNLYSWSILWGMAMLVPDSWNKKLKVVAYMCVCGIHGLSYGTLSAPIQALMFGLDFNGMLAWIIAGIPFDITHGVSNFCSAVLVLPLANVLKKLERM